MIRPAQPAPPPAFEKPVFVTRPLLPPLPDYTALLQEVWASGWLTNNGHQHQQLEAEVAAWLRARHLSLFNNGTIAMIVACQALRLAGEVITSPFTFPATPHVLSWNGLTPVFADIDPDTLCISPNEVESHINGRTSGVLGVHVYGIPCDVVALGELGRRHGLRVLYDGAHAFGTQVDGQPIAEFGDATMFSFHATKLFHSAEGGALVVNDADVKRRIDLLKNFGIKNEEEVIMPGINGKMSEVNAALGRVVLRHVDQERARRAQIRALYAERLGQLPGLRLIDMPSGVADSLQYLVLRVNADEAGCTRDTLHARLQRFNIVARKYFYPLCSQYSCYRNLPTANPANLPHAHRAAQEVMTLPYHGGLSDSDVLRIGDALAYSLVA